MDRDFVNKNSKAVKEPEYKRLYKPSRPYKKYNTYQTEKTTSVSRFFLIFELIKAILIGLFFGLIFDEWKHKIILIVIIYIILLIRLIINDDLFVTREKEIVKTIELSEEEFNEKYDEYERNLEKYLKEKPIIEKHNKEEKLKYKKNLNGHLNKEFLTHHRSNLSPSTEPVREFSINRGRTDIQFLKLIREKFPRNIYLDLMPEYGTYYPDIVFICNETELHIDIEIDEPYTLKDKKPIHYMDSDNERNNFFLSRNWVIIRFTEKQIKQNPEGCISTISSVHQSIVNLKNSFKNYVTPEKAWTYEDAVILATENYRSS